MKNIYAYGVLFALSLLIPATSTQAAGLNNSIYVPVEPCRVGNTVPTKVTAGNFIEWLAYGADLSSQGGAGNPGCPQPKTGMNPIGAALNVTVVGNQATGNGNVVAYPADVAVAPSSSLVNYKPGTNIANSTIVGLCQDGVCDGKFKLQSNNSDVPVIADVQGYFYPAPGNVVNVALSGGDYSSPVDAMADVANWCGTPSASNQCLVKIAPGTYTVTETVVMQQWVSIQGAGQVATKITGAVSTGSANATSAVLTGANNTALTNLAVENTGGSVYSAALYNRFSSPRIERVTASASGGSSTNYGVRNSSSSPTIINVTASASGGTNNYGVLNSGSSSPTMTNITASASGGTSLNYGVSNNSSSSPTMTNVTATASGGTNSYGIYNITSSSPTITNVTATGSGGGISYGVFNTNISSAFIQDSVLKGGTSGLSIDTTSTGTRVVNSKIVGGVNDGPNTTTNCRGNYDAALTSVTC